MLAALFARVYALPSAANEPALKGLYAALQHR
jgi:hypothetical protein